jgi:hypothetical protein
MHSASLMYRSASCLRWAFEVVLSNVANPPMAMSARTQSSSILSASLARSMTFIDNEMSLRAKPDCLEL